MIRHDVDGGDGRNLLGRLRIAHWPWQGTLARQDIISAKISVKILGSIDARDPQ
jgi:hypothetical protein